MRTVSPHVTVHVCPPPPCRPRTTLAPPSHQPSRGESAHDHPTVSQRVVIASVWSLHVQYCVRDRTVVQDPRRP